VLGKTGCTLLAFPCTALLDVSFMQPLKTCYAQETEIWMKSHPNTVVTHYKTAGLVGKDYLKSATTAIVADEIRKTGLLPCKCHIFDERDFVEESQRTFTRCLLESPVPYTNISDQPSTTSGTNPQTLPTVTLPASQNAPALVLPSNIGPVRDIFGRKQEHSTKHAAFPQRICCYFDELALRKQTSRRQKENRE